MERRVSDETEQMLYQTAQGWFDQSGLWEDGTDLNVRLAAIARALLEMNGLPVPELPETGHGPVLRRR